MNAQKQLAVLVDSLCTPVTSTNAQKVVTYGVDSLT